MNDDRDTQKDEWKVGWEDRRQQQMAMALAASPAQRLAWLEEMIAIAHRTGALPKKDE